MTNETVLFSIMIALPLITIAAYFIAQFIININDRNDQKTLAAILLETGLSVGCR